MSDDCRKDAYERSFRGKFRKAKHEAKRRSLEWELTLDEYLSVVAPDQCHYCHRSLSRYGSGLDRIDNAVGYTLDNVLPCCGHCNQIRGDNLSPKEMMIVAQMVKLIRELF